MENVRTRAFAALLVIILLASCGGDVGWREFRSAEGRFSIMLPGKPQEQSQKTATAFGAIEAHVFLVDRDGAGYSAIYMDYPLELVQDSPVDVVLDGLSVGIVSQSGGTLLSSNTIWLGEFEGRHLEISSPTRDSVLQVQLYLVGNRVYQLSVIAKPSAAIIEDAELFFGSFALLDQ